MSVGRDLFGHHKDGHEFPVEVALSPVEIDGEPMVLSALVDITVRKRMQDELRKAHEELEDRVRRRTAELSAAKSELKAFAYSVSHDLCVPLRGIDGFSQALQEDNGDKFDERGTDYLNRVWTATQRMGDLIDGLLELSQVTRSELRRKSVDLSAMA